MFERRKDEEDSENSVIEEIFIPDRLPWRKYIFTFGKEDKIPKACADSYNELRYPDDRFTDEYRLIIQRTDGNEMDYYERMELRKEFLKNWLDTYGFEGGDYMIESIYKNKKLYFWAIKKSYYPESKEDFANKIKLKLCLKRSVVK